MQIQLFYIFHFRSGFKYEIIKNPFSENSGILYALPYEVIELNNILKKHKNIHLHCPEGSVSKDGPSAGLALSLLFYSLYNKKQKNNKIAVTGEINLQEDVLQIGELEEKLYGAKKEVIKKVLIPCDNMDDFEKIKLRNPNLVNNYFKVLCVKNFSQALDIMF